MGLFNKLKNLVIKKEKESAKKEVQDSLETYDKGLKKTRDEFVSKLSLLGIKYT